MFRTILGMSKSRSDLAAWIEDHTFQVIIAITQLYLFNFGNRVHWRKEVWEKFHEMHVFRHNSKLPEAKFILDNSWKINKQYIKDAVKFAIDKETEYTPRPAINLYELENILESYFMWLADELSKHRVITLTSVLKKLDSLGLAEEGNNWKQIAEEGNR